MRGCFKDFESAWRRERRHRISIAVMYNARVEREARQ